MTTNLSKPQKRLLATIQEYGEGAEYWHIVNAWVKDSKLNETLVLRNINRCVEALLRTGLVTLDDSGCFHLRGN